MTQNELLSLIEKAENEYKARGNSESAREALQSVFSDCFSKAESGEGCTAPLERAYRLLRRIENNSAVTDDFGYRYDIGFVCEGLTVCAEIMSHQSGRRFTLERDFESAFVNIELKSLCKALLNLFANAVKYSDGNEIGVKMGLFDGFVVVTVTNEGHFDAADFQNALSGNGSLGFVGRVLNLNGGSVVMTDGDEVSLALKIPLCKKELPVILPFAVEDLLYDRTSPVYVAFCAH